MRHFSADEVLEITPEVGQLISYLKDSITKVGVKESLDYVYIKEQRLQPGNVMPSEYSIVVQYPKGDAEVAISVELLKRNVALSLAGDPSQAYGNAIAGPAWLAAYDVKHMVDYTNEQTGETA